MEKGNRRLPIGEDERESFPSHNETLHLRTRARAHIGIGTLAIKFI